MNSVQSLVDLAAVPFLIAIVAGMYWAYVRMKMERAKHKTLERDMHRRFPKGTVVCLDGYGDVEVLGLYSGIRQVMFRSDSGPVTVSWDLFLELVGDLEQPSTEESGEDHV